jgi:hypothetical protein
MRVRVVVPAFAAAVALGAGLGAYFVAAGAPLRPIPKAEQSPPLEEARAEGVISGYRVIPGPYGTHDYEVAGGEISLKFPNACGYRGCPGWTPVILIEYRNTAEDQARAILKITQRWAQRSFRPPIVAGPPDYRSHPEGQGYRIIFGPPYYP